AGIAVADETSLLATEFQRGKSCVLPYGSGGNLIEGDAIVNIGTGRLFRMYTGQITGRRACVISRTIPKASAAILVKPGDHHGVIPERCERLQDSEQGEPRAVLRRSPILHDDSIRDIDYRQTVLGFQRLTCRAGESRHHSIQEWQSYGRPDPAEQYSSRE